uniref:Putative methyltransferase n=1 Tax=viral metagenome TaxID=1070528 RepID=A0A6H1ZWL7_9ZZZZ
MIKYFSLFSGIGGLEYGLEKNGIGKCVGYSEIKESSIKIYQSKYLNYNNYGDITKLDIKGMQDFNLLLGGFPCQSFSLAGIRKGFKDKRGKMIFYIYEILKEKKPEYFVLENVKGLLNHNKGNTYIKVLKLLMFAGYYVRVLLLNSIFYGSPQNRERIFILGALDNYDRVIPERIDDRKIFRDIEDKNENGYKMIPETENNIKKVNQRANYNYELIGGYDRVGALMTSYGCGNKVVRYKDWFRYLTLLECERLQGFPDGWTEGENNRDRYFALGNAVNCNVSDYLFNNYLKEVWRWN